MELADSKAIVKLELWVMTGLKSSVYEHSRKSVAQGALAKNIIYAAKLNLYLCASCSLRNSFVISDNRALLSVFSAQYYRVRNLLNMSFILIVSESCCIAIGPSMALRSVRLHLERSVSIDYFLLFVFGVWIGVESVFVAEDGGEDGVHHASFIQLDSGVEGDGGAAEDGVANGEYMEEDGEESGERREEVEGEDEENATGGFPIDYDYNSMLTSFFGGSAM
nr:hypothetical protein Iba_chr10dCG10080 [Ipomoea batatas]